MRNIIISLSILAGALSCGALTSCSEDITATAELSEVSVRVELPADVDATKVTDATLRFTNLSNSAVTAVEAGGEVKLMPGLYDVAYEARCDTGAGGEKQLRGVANSVTIGAGSALVEIKPFLTVENDDFIISEVFFTGTLQPSGNQYYGDDYIKIYNNTDHVLYADGLTIFESKFTTTQKFEYTPDIMPGAMTVQALYTIPGSGHDHPVPPGGELLIADTGIDHRTLNPNSFDLSHADFEWYDVSTKPAHMDIDSPTVPNLDKWYCYTLSFWVLHNRGFKAFGVARIPVEREEYLRDYWYSYDYVIVTDAGSFPMSQSAYRLPNEWITDVVNCSVESIRAWNVCAPELDMGWSYCGKIDKDKTRYFHSVRRKVREVSADGRKILQDTNDSSSDFIPMATPSEIERQGTPTGL